MQTHAEKKQKRSDFIERNPAEPDNRILKSLKIP